MAVRPAAEAAFDTTVPVLIIGAGACGLTAALAARETGADPLILERDARPTGSTTLSTGLIPAADTRFQRALGIADSPALFAADIIKKAKHQTDARMAHAIATASGPTIEWLADRGVAFRLVDGFLYPGHSVLRMHGTPNRTGGELEAALLAAAGAARIDILTSAHATDLYVQDDGRVTAVRVARPDGTRETIGCGALVLACNGFGGNRAMVRELIPEMGDAEYSGHAGNQGDAIAWGRALGAATADLGGYQGHGAVAWPYNMPVVWGLIMGGGYQVNRAAARFANEASGYSEHAVEVVRQPEHVAWEIFDAAREAIALEFKDYQDVRALGGIKHADTLDDLARIIGLDAGALAATNAGVDAMRAGAPCPFGRDFTGTAPLSPPFRAVKVTGTLFHTQGGLVVDQHARVLRPDGSALPNLFAGGGAACGLSGPSRWGYLSGNGLLTATVLGRIAGTVAARLAY